MDVREPSAWIREASGQRVASAVRPTAPSDVVRPRLRHRLMVALRSASPSGARPSSPSLPPPDDADTSEHAGNCTHAEPSVAVPRVAASASWRVVNQEREEQSREHPSTQVPEDGTCYDPEHSPEQVDLALNGRPMTVASSQWSTPIERPAVLGSGARGQNLSGSPSTRKARTAEGELRDVP